MNNCKNNDLNKDQRWFFWDEFANRAVKSHHPGTEKKVEEEISQQLSSESSESQISEIDVLSWLLRPIRGLSTPLLTGINDIGQSESVEDNKEQSIEKQQEELAEGNQGKSVEEEREELVEEGKEKVLDSILTLKEFLEADAKKLERHLKDHFGEILRTVFIEKYFQEEFSRIIFFEITDIQYNFSTMILGLKLADDLLDYFKLDETLIEILIKRCIPEVLQRLFPISREIVDLEIYWDIFFSDEAIKEYDKRKKKWDKRPESPLYSGDKILKVSLSVYLALTIVIEFLTHQKIKFLIQEGIGIEVDVDADINADVNANSRPPQVIIEPQCCTCGFCDRCLPDCSPC